MRVINALQSIDGDRAFSVFLAGSVQSKDTEVTWRKRIIKMLSEEDVVLIDPVWTNNGSNLDYNNKEDAKKMNVQIDWELNALEQADLIVMHLDKEAKSPISLLELGLYAQSGKLVMCCADGFWRKENVDVVCNRYNVPRVKSIEELVTTIQKKLE